MSSEVQKYIDKTVKKKLNLLNARVINFPKDKRLIETENLKLNNLNIWKISDSSNDDQLKAVIGICFTLVALTLLGLYSNLF